MTRVLLAFGLVIMMTLSATAPTWAQEESTGVAVGYEPGQRADAIEVLMAEGTTGTQVPLFLSYDGEAPLKAALLYGGLRDAEGRPVSTAVVRFLEPSADGTPLGRIDLETRHGASQILLSISDLTAFGVFSGFIAVDVGGRSSRVADLVVERPAEPVLVIQEASDGTQITLTTFGPQLDDSLLLLETGGEATEQRLELTLGQLRAAGGRGAELSIDPRTLALTPYLAQTVRIAGQLPEVGEFRGTLTLTFGDLQKTYSVLAKRELGQDQVALEATSQAAITRLPWSDVSASVELDLAETGGRQTSYYAPHLKKLVEAGAGADRPGARFDRWELLDGQGAVVARAGSEDAQTTFALAPSQAHQMTLVIRGLRGSGQYEGTVEITTPGGVRVSDTFALFVKDHWLFPALVIFLGALGSYGLRRWLQTGRPQAIEEMSIRRTLNRVVAAVGDESDLIRRALVDRLQELMETNRVQPDTDVKAGLAELTTQLNNYVVIRDALDLRPALDGLVPDPEGRQTILAALNELEETLSARQLAGLQADSEGENELVTQAREIRKQLESQAQASLKAAVSGLMALLDEEAAVLTVSELPEPTRDALARQLTSLKDRLKGARDDVLASEAATGPQALRMARNARVGYESTRKEYETWRAERLRQTLHAQADPPLGFSKPDWEALREELLAMIPAGATPESVEAAQRAYLRAVLDALQKQAQKDAEAVQQIQDARDQAPLFAAIATNAGQALAAIDTDTAQMHAAYLQLTKDYQEAVDAARASGAPMGAPGEEVAHLAPGVAAGAVPGSVGAALPPARAAIDIPELSTIRRRIDRNDLWALAIVSAVSVLVGLQLLWAGSDDFGGLVDYISVFLWGFGLNELNKVALPAAASQLGLPWFPAANSAGGKGPGGGAG